MSETKRWVKSIASAAFVLGSFGLTVWAVVHYGLLTEALAIFSCGFGLMGLAHILHEEVFTE